jgi:hypothetical protein
VKWTTKHHHSRCPQINGREETHTQRETKHNTKFSWDKEKEEEEEERKALEVFFLTGLKMMSLCRTAVGAGLVVVRMRSAFTGTRYAKSHEYVTAVDGSDVAHIGISDYAQKALGDLVFVELPAAGVSKKKGVSV